MWESRMFLPTFPSIVCKLWENPGFGFFHDFPQYVISTKLLSTDIIIRENTGGFIMSQIHKKFTDNQVKRLLDRYLKKEIERKYIQEILGIKRRRFFELLKKYKEDPDDFSVQYERKQSKRIPKEIEDIILDELAVEKQIIESQETPVKCYNYSYIKDLLENKYDQKISLPTIINRAKENGYYLKKRAKRSVHDREVLTNFAGELIQHDSSHHLWAPAAKEKWYLITSLDDYSRLLLYASLVRKETSWTHIEALQSLMFRYGLPYTFYVDSHSIFRFVQGRDSNWRKHHKITDEASPQWKQVLDDCNVKVIYALSPQAKGKIERPYQWLQDRLVRTCVRENVTDIKQAQLILKQELNRYNYRQVHSTTKEVPYYRFKNALQKKKSLFRPFEVISPFKSAKDIFCLRINRIADSYRRISINNLKLKVNKVNPRDEVTLKFHPLKNGICEVRFWVKNILVDIQNIKKSDLRGVHF